MSSILVVEDTQDNFELVEDALEEMHQVVHATSGRDGLSQARALQPDLILLDMGMPDMDGWEVARRLKADPDLAHIPVIALTAHAMTGDRERCLEVGCDDYMAKPIDLRGLSRMVDHHLTPESSGEAEGRLG